MLKQIEISAGDVLLPGELQVPRAPIGLVVFAHGSGSNHQSPGNHFVARQIQKSGFATLLCDLLTAEEQRDLMHSFDIDLMASRLVEIIGWLDSQTNLTSVPFNILGAGTGAAAALKAAAQLGKKIHSVVCRGGRPDFAYGEIHKVTAPSLFIVGETDSEVLASNRHAMHSIMPPTVKHMEIIKGAGHLFSEPGALEEVAGLSGRWFSIYGSSRQKGDSDHRPGRSQGDATFLY